MAENATAPRPGLTLTVKGEDLNLRGEGIARWQGWVLVIPELLPGELARVQLVQRRRSQWIGRRLETLFVASGARTPPCILARRCGGCTLQHWDEAHQSAWKRDRLVQTLARIGGLHHPVEPLEPPGMGAAFGYRNRALLPLQRDSEGQLRMGYYKRGSHQLVNLNHCPVLDPGLDELLAPLKADLQATGWPADADLHQGDGLRHLGLRLGSRSREVLITLISSSAELPGVHRVAQGWCDRWPQVKGVTLNLQPRRTNTVLGPQTLTLAGAGTVVEKFCGLQLTLASTTFFQVNTKEAERAVLGLRQWLLTQAGPIALIDAYCGIGTIALPLAAAGHSVLGLEVHQESVEQARRNAENNGLMGVRFLAGDVRQHLAEALPHHQALVVDPPRKGLEPTVTEQILACPPRWLAYLSCDPATLARDLARLAGPEAPYRIHRLQPFDFFPQTSHLECLALLERVSS
jgi:23S rRNA (uracil1939-C5)-methyltransferase